MYRPDPFSKATLCKSQKMRNLCTNQESADKIEALLPKIENVSEQEEEKWLIKALPSDWSK